MQKRSGFSLALVLVIMVFIIGISAVIMDMTTNYVSSSQATIDHQKLYNAAQSGIEWGKAWLIQNKSVLDNYSPSSVNHKYYNDDLDNIRVSKSGSFYSPFNVDVGDNNINVEVWILDCNYSLGTGSYTDNLPPIIYEWWPSGAEEGNQVGFSNIVDPNRNISGISGEPGHVFVVSSKAIDSENMKDITIESMVVIAQ